MLVYAICAILCLPLALPAQAGRVEHLKRGDTTIVRTTGNGVWGPPSNAVEVLRVGGGENANTSFGDVTEISALPDGGVVVFDRKGFDGPVFRLFDKDGKFLRNLGRDGGGPGEFGKLGFNYLKVAPNGMVLMLDPGNHRVNRYLPSGKVLPSIESGGFGGGPPFYFLLGPQGSVYIRQRVQKDREGAAFDMDAWGYVHRDSTGKITDSVFAQHSGATVTPTGLMQPVNFWTVILDGRVLVASTDRMSFLLKTATGKGSLLRIEAPTTRPRVLDEERREYLAQIEWSNKATQGSGEPAVDMTLPATKPAFISAITDVSGRIVVRKYGVSEKVPPEQSGRDAKGNSGPPRTYREPQIYAFFQVDGTYLGEVTFPVDASRLSFTGTIAWGIVPGRDDEPMLVKYRISPPK